MSHFGKIAICLAGGLVFTARLYAEPALIAAADGSPYSPIVDRNVFGLLPPPDPKAQDDAAALASLPKITANGIMDVFGNLKVLFKTSGKPGEKDNYYDLAEGMSEDNITVKKIDEKAGIIIFENHGTVEQVALVSPSSGSKGGDGSGGSGNGGSGGMPGHFGGNPGPGRGGFNGGGFNGGGGTFKSYGSSGGGQNGFNNGMNNGNNGGYNGGGAPGGGININGQQLSFGGTSYSGTRSTTTLPSDGMTAEQQALIIEVNRAQTQQQVTDGEMPPLPPTMITPPGSTGIGGQPLGGTEGNNEDSAQ
ncbi:MAG TPA: hypothetical protein VGN23_13070 [Verrucomicrobiae bacterium]